MTSEIPHYEALISLVLRFEIQIREKLAPLIFASIRLDNISRRELIQNSPLTQKSSGRSPRPLSPACFCGSRSGNRPIQNLNIVSVQS
jgi:hypothetical protein